MKILVLDAETRTALAVIRSLGKAGHEVTAVSSSKRAVGFLSRYCSGKIISPSPRGRADEYHAFLRELLRDTGAAVLLPTIESTLHLVLEIEDEIRNRAHLPFVSKALVDQISDKHQLTLMAAELGINVPRYTEITASMMETPRDLAAAVQECRFPAVARPLKSTVRIEGHLVKPNVKYLVTPQDAFKFFKDVRTSVLKDVPHVLQQIVEGKSICVLVLCAWGEPLVTFGYQRLLTADATGSNGILNESIAVEEAPVGPALKLLRALEWHGIALVEFRESATGERYFSNLRPVFGDGAQLCVDAGCNLPRYLADIAACQSDSELQAIVKALSAKAPYPAGMRTRAFFESVDYGAALIKRDFREGVRKVLAENSLQFFKAIRTTNHEAFRWGDYRPGLADFESWVGGVFRKKDERN